MTPRIVSRRSAKAIMVEIDPETAAALEVIAEVLDSDDIPPVEGGGRRLDESTVHLAAIRRLVREHLARQKLLGESDARTPRSAQGDEEDDIGR